MSKFTEGEWEYDKEYIFLPNGKWYQPNGFVYDEEEQANARLIAAAPEMYELLESIVSLLSVHSYSQGEAVKIHQLLARIDGEEAEHD